MSIEVEIDRAGQIITAIESSETSVEAIGHAFDGLSDILLEILAELRIARARVEAISEL